MNMIGAVDINTTYLIGMGVFYIRRMAFEDFKTEFTRLEICMLSPDSAGDVDRKRWEANVYQGSWQKSVSAGGCRNFPDTFYVNPQFK